MDWKLEVVGVPVSDMDRSIAFYKDTVGFNLDHDTMISEGVRIAQLTPRGSGCSIVISTGLLSSAPGTLQGVQIVVDDIVAAHAELVGRGLECSPVQHFENGQWIEGRGGDWNSFVLFNDPDGNGWSLQERPASKS